jgi:TolA-binding protein
MERRLSEVTANSEQRIAILREAMAHFAARELAERDERIATLKKKVAELTQELEQKTAIDQQVAEIVKRLDAQASARDAAKRGAKGERGERGARGERGPVGSRGPKGRPADPALKVHSWHIDKYRVTAFFKDGSSWPTLDLRPCFQTYDDETR